MTLKLVGLQMYLVPATSDSGRRPRASRELRVVKCGSQGRGVLKQGDSSARSAQFVLENSLWLQLPAIAQGSLSVEEGFAASSKRWHPEATAMHCYVDDLHWSSHDEDDAQEEAENRNERRFVLIEAGNFVQPHLGQGQFWSSHDDLGVKCWGPFDSSR